MLNDRLSDCPRPAGMAFGLAKGSARLPAWHQFENSILLKKRYTVYHIPLCPDDHIHMTFAKYYKSSWHNTTGRISTWKILFNDPLKSKGSLAMWSIQIDEDQ